MGIPSYFSYIIRNYPKIVKNLKFHKKNQQDFHHLFMDSNSIIYDAIKDIKPDEYNFEQLLIEKVIQNIENYIQQIKPSKTIFIAFDGVAPFAKMNQQKTRRYKSAFMANLGFINNKVNTNSWSTSNITPGTNFMSNLSKSVRKAFLNTEKKYNVNKVIVSGSNENGEGEHKIFEYIRNNPFYEENMILYGLDSDLIMLSLFHSHYYKNGYIFREAPEFIKSSIPLADSDKNTNEPYVLDISLLADSILIEMNCKCKDRKRIYDYVFLCFMLGNDFLPHFPALNIRTHGIPVLLGFYTDIIGNYSDRFFISDDNKIQWKYFKMFIHELSKREHEFIVQEYAVRDKKQKRNYKIDTVEEQENVLNQVPTIYRSEELYICPSHNMWEERYYKSLFHLDRNHDNLHKICNNYLEALEWVFTYYSSGCSDWRWTYEYHYPPLLVDLYKYIPNGESKFILNNRQAFTENVQLSYVLPPSNFNLLPEYVSSKLLKEYSNLFSSKLEFQWAFCSYFWESHVCFKNIPLETLEKWEYEFL